MNVKTIAAIQYLKQSAKKAHWAEQQKLIRAIANVEAIIDGNERTVESEKMAEEIVKEDE